MFSDHGFLTLLVESSFGATRLDAISYSLDTHSPIEKTLWIIGLLIAMSLLVLLFKAVLKSRQAEEKAQRARRKAARLRLKEQAKAKSRKTSRFRRRD